MQLTPNAQAAILLTVSLGKSDAPAEKPLSNKEWARFAVWLKDHGLDPASLLKGDLDALLSGWMDRKVTTARLRGLLNRGPALGLLLEKWERAGLWVLARSDPDYPERLKRHIGAESPPVLFGCGNTALLNRGGIAVVGSRDASDDDLAFTEKLGKAAADQGYSIVSGGARGVDQHAMLGALDSEGTAIGVLADSLLKTATSSRYRKRIMSGDLALVTTFNPEAGFNVGNAMARNRYIYCLADAAVVISSTADKGGTWNGALEDLKTGWTPLWVKPTKNAHSGNPELVRRGAHWLPDDLASLSILLNGAGPASPRATQDSLLLKPRSKERDDKPAKERKTKASSPPPAGERTQSDRLPAALPAEARRLADVDFYTLFLAHMAELTSTEPMAAADIAARLKLEKSQANAWLKRAVSEGKVAKLKRPVRYQADAAERRQASLFVDEE